MEKWTIIRLHEFCQKESVVRFLQDKKLLPTTKSCPTCETNMELKNEDWRCWKTTSSKKGKRKCNSKISVREGTIFEGSKLSFEEVLLTFYFCVKNYEQLDGMHEIGVNKNTISRWMKIIRRILVKWAVNSSQKVGGIGKTVEIDESKFGKRKYEKGHHVEGQWVFGGIERESGQVFLIPVENRSKTTLLDLIKSWILPGTAIVSDCWKPYADIHKEGFEHLTVNHSLTFVDPDTGVHTNTIESTWRHAKVFLPTYSRKKNQFTGYLAHYLFYKRCRKLKLDFLNTFLDVIASLSHEDVLDCLLYNENNTESDTES